MNHPWPAMPLTRKHEDSDGDFVAWTGHEIR
jgi:hypothetical protein